MTGFHRYLLRRLLITLLTLVGVATLVFLLVRLLPGDPARLIAGLEPTEEEIVRIRRELGLDRPLAIQYVVFLGNLVQGDMGRSARTKAPVLDEVMARLPKTLQLAAISMVLASALGIFAGVVGATRRYSLFDYLASTGSLFGIAMPVYWLGLMLILLFAVRLHWLPAAGAEKPQSFILPSVTLAAFSLALVARMTRSSMLEVLNQDYIRTARAKGLQDSLVFYRHALRNAAIPVITVVSLQFGTLLGGAVLTETVFAWPGMGRLLVDSIFARDYPVVQGAVLLFSFLFTLVNLLADLLYAYVDPRIHYH
jgi:ABC-type dipeptide/oligopeptide/nickel transport system permease component